MTTTKTLRSVFSWLVSQVIFGLCFWKMTIYKHKNQRSNFVWLALATLTSNMQKTWSWQIKNLSKICHFPNYIFKQRSLYLWALNKKSNIYLKQVYQWHTLCLLASTAGHLLFFPDSFLIITDVVLSNACNRKILIICSHRVLLNISCK